MKYVLPLSESARSRWLTGPKAARLAELLNAGHRVPDGFVIGFNAFNDHLLAQRDPLDALLDRVESLHASELGDLPAQVRALILATPLSELLQQELAQTVSKGVQHGVSVRSSSSLEDRASTSFAGQHDSYLNLTGMDRVAEKVLAVWASTYSDRALCYLRSLHISVRELQMGVIVQQMVQAQSSGVAFSVHPVSGDKDVVQISAALGLGETTVAGMLTPDDISVRRTDLQISAYHPGDKAVRVVGSADGVAHEPVAAHERSSHALSDAAAIEIAQTTLAIEQLMGGDPQDVEWARDAEHLWILQARPLRVRAATQSIRWESPVPNARWRRNWRLGEWIPDAVTPLFASWLLPKLVASREEFGTGALGWKGMDSFSMPRPWFCIVNGYFYTRQDFPLRALGRASSPDERVEQMKRTAARIAAWHREDLPAYVEHFKRHAELDLGASTSSELLRRIDLLVEEAGEIWSFLSPIGYGFEELAFKPLYDRLLPGAKPHHSRLFSGYPSRMVDAQIALCEIARRVRGDAALVALFGRIDSTPDLEQLPGWVQRAIEGYNADYGHQVLSLDTYWPTLGETAEHTLSSLQALVVGEVPDPARALAEAAERREKAVAEVLGRLGEDAAKQSRFATTIAYYQGNAAVREDCNFYLQIGWPLIRKSLHILAERLVARGVLDDLGQIHFLEKDELFGVVADDSARANLSRLAASRHETWQSQRALVAPMTLSDEAETRRGWDAETGSMQAIGASVGIGRGQVRVVLDDRDARQFKRGEILVTRAASPLLTPLMLMASGLIVEVGGGASHSSLVARELGLPAVVNAESATSVFRNGQTVEIDGEQGWIRLVPAP